jgi:hypothetical protein
MKWVAGPSYIRSASSSKALCLRWVVWQREGIKLSKPHSKPRVRKKKRRRRDETSNQAAGDREASSVVTGRLKLALAWPIIRLKLSSPMC